MRRSHQRTGLCVQKIILHIRFSYNVCSLLRFAYMKSKRKMLWDESIGQPTLSVRGRKERGLAVHRSDALLYKNFFRDRVRPVEYINICRRRPGHWSFCGDDWHQPRLRLTQPKLIQTSHLTLSDPSPSFQTFYPSLPCSPLLLLLPLLPVH